MLDVSVSRYKHEVFGDLNSHCKSDTCAANHTATSLAMPTDTLVGFLTTLDHGRVYVARQLDVFRVPHVEVKYEKLYYAPTAHEWKRLLRFVGVNFSKNQDNNLTMKQVEQHMHYVATHPPVRNVTLTNYDEIVKNLKGTKWEPLLIPVWEEALQ